MTAAKQDLLHRKAECTAIEAAFQQLHREAAGLGHWASQPEPGGVCTGQAWRSLPEEVQVAWLSVARGKRFALGHQTAVPSGLRLKQIAADVGVIETGIAPRSMEDGWAEVESGAVVTWCAPTHTHHERLVSTLLDFDANWTEATGNATYQPRILTLSEVMALKTASTKTPKAQMNSMDLLEHIMYNAWKRWCLNSLEGGGSKLRSRGWTDIRNRSTNQKARAQREQAATQCGPECTPEVVKSQSQSRVEELKNAIRENGASATASEQQAEVLQTEIEHHEAAGTEASDRHSASAVQVQRAFDERESHLESISNLETIIREAQAKKKAAKASARKLKTAITKHQRAMEREETISSRCADELDKLRPARAQAIEDAATFRSAIGEVESELLDYHNEILRDLEAKEQDAVASRNYEQAAKIRDEIELLIN